MFFLVTSFFWKKKDRRAAQQLCDCTGMGIRKREGGRKISRQIKKKKKAVGRRVPHPAFEEDWNRKSSLVKNFAAAGLALDPNKAVPIKGNEKLNYNKFYDKTPESGRKPKSKTIAALEEIAARPSDRPDHVPEGESLILQDLIRKHGDDYTKMARDMKLNAYQHTANQLKRRCAKYLSEFGDPRSK